jgi:hypothetical protein
MVLLLLPHFDIKPIFFTLLEPTGTTEAYAVLGANTVKELNDHDVRVGVGHRQSNECKWTLFALKIQLYSSIGVKN